MALWMEAGSEPATEQERADLGAISALKESAALELKEQGNQYVKMGKSHYADAVDCYTRAINQKVLGDVDTSVLYANRAHVNLLLGNNRRALVDAELALKLNSTNVKAYYRGAKAALSLDLLSEAASFCYRGLQHFPSNEELKKLEIQVNLRIQETENSKHRVFQAVSSAKDLAGAMERRGLNLGKAMYQGLSGLRKPRLDECGVLHWPVLLLYAEVMSSDFIQDFCETDSFSVHLDMMYSGSSEQLSWDTEHAYTREAVELYYESNSGVRLSKKEILKYLLEGTAGSLADHIYGEAENEEDKPDLVSSINGSTAGRWIKVNEKEKLQDILRQPGYIIPGIPVFFVVSKRSAFYEEFRAGNWSPP